MAISSTVCGAVLVENGQRLGESGRFVNQQWLWFNVAAMAAAIAGGQLAERLSPAAALHAAAGIVAIAPFAVLYGAHVFDAGRESQNRSAGAARLRFAGLAAAFRRRELWIVAGSCFSITSVPA